MDGADLVVEAVGAGTDLVYATASYALAAGSEVEILSTSDNSATTAIDLTGNAIANTLYGNAGVNRLSGGGGADVMVGLGGNDVYFVDNVADYVDESAGGGADVVYTNLSYAMAWGQEIEVLSVDDHGATTAINLTGNEYANILYGNAGVNRLFGGDGADVMLGFGGDDVFFVNSADDVVGENVGGGSDIVFSYVSYALAAGSEVEILSTNDNSATTALDLTGNDLANTLYGNAGANRLDGGAGADLLVGLGGNDVYVVDTASDLVSEAVGGGYDVVYAGLSYTLAAGYEVEVLSVNDHGATTAIDFTGNEFANGLYGNAGDNVLDGKGGSDALLGFGGADTFAFTTALGAGNVDVLGDFLSATDKIALDDAIFTQIGGLGALGAGAFVTGTGAQDGNDRIVYNSTTGQLFYDADGSGGSAQVLFATLNPGTALAASDFVVI